MAVLVSILGAMTAAATASYEYTGAIDSDNDGVYDGKVTFTGTGDLTGVNFYHTSYGAGVVGALPHSGPDGNVPTQHTAPSSEIILTDAQASKVATSGVCGYAVMGDKTLTVKNSSVGYIYGGYMDSNGGGVQLFDQPSWSENRHFAPQATPGSKMTINISEGSDIGYIYAGSYYTSDRLDHLQASFLEEGKTSLDYDWTPLTMTEAVDITVNDSAVDGIMGSMSGAVRDNKVTITINDSAEDSRNTTVGYIMAGGQSYSETFKASIKSTHVIVNGGAVTGNIYGGSNSQNSGGVVKEGTRIDINGGTVGTAGGKGNICGGGGTGSVVYGGTEININGGTVKNNVYGAGFGEAVHGGTVVNLKGGTIEGSVFAAGNGDTVYGGTKVVISGAGTDVKGTINGDGTNGSVVKGDRILSFDGYTGGVKDAAGVTQLTETERTKYQGFNVLEVKNMSANLGEVSSYDKLSIENSSASISLLTMENGAEVNNAGSLELTDVIMTGGSTFVHAGETTIQGDLSMDNAMLNFSPASHQSATGGITFVGGASITNLSNLQISATFGDASVIDALLATPHSQEEFSFVVFAGLENLEDAGLIESLAAAFDEDMLTLRGIDSEGNLQNLIINGAHMTYHATAGTLTVSGTMSVPEPTTATLSLLALAALAARRRRR